MNLSLYSSIDIFSALVFVERMRLNFSVIMCYRHRYNSFCSFLDCRHFTNKENFILRDSRAESRYKVKIECCVYVKCCRIYHDVIFVIFEFFVEKKKINRLFCCDSKLSRLSSSFINDRILD